MKNTTVLIISVVAFLFSLFLAKPKEEEINNNLNSDKEKLWLAIDIKKADLTNNLAMFDPQSGEAKYVNRLTVPAFMRVAHLDRHQMHYVQIFLGFLIFLLWTLIASSFLPGWRSVLLSSLALAGVYYGKAFNIDSGTPVNTLSYFLILFCLYFRGRIYLLIPALIMLFFNDERGILAFSLIGLFILFWDRSDLRDIRSAVLDRSLLALAGTFILCCGARIALQMEYNMTTPLGTIGLDIFKGQWKQFPNGLFSGLVGFSAVIVYGFWVLARQRMFIMLLMALAVTALFIVGTAIVSDMTKSIAVITPLALLLLKKLKETDPESLRINTYTAIVNALHPTVVVVGVKSFFYYTVALDIIFKVINIFHKS